MTCVAIVSAFLQKCAPYCVKTVTDLSGLLPQKSLNTLLCLDPLCQDGQSEILQTKAGVYLWAKIQNKHTYFLWQNMMSITVLPPNWQPKKNWSNTADLCYTIQQWLEQSTAVGTGSFMYASFSTYTRLIFWFCVLRYNLYKYKFKHFSHYMSGVVFFTSTVILSSKYSQSAQNYPLPKVFPPYF